VGEMAMPVGMPSSLLPRPNPLHTIPPRKKGKVVISNNRREGGADFFFFFFFLCSSLVSQVLLHLLVAFLCDDENPVADTGVGIEEDPGILGVLFQHLELVERRKVLIEETWGLLEAVPLHLPQSDLVRHCGRHE